MSRKVYQSDVSDDEWALIAPYLTLMIEVAPQRSHSMREVLTLYDGCSARVRRGE
jgi:transposase